MTMNFAAPSWYPRPTDSNLSLSPFGLEDLEQSELIRRLAFLRLHQQSPENYSTFSCSTSVENLHNDYSFDDNVRSVREDDDDDVINDLCYLLKPKVPPVNYICHNCFTTGHYIQNCPKGALRNQCSTPYQGFKRSFGRYICPKCKRSWSSSNSFSEIGQECRKCKITVFPRKQFKLAKKVIPDDLNNTNCTNSFFGKWQMAISDLNLSSPDESRSTSRSSYLII